MRQAGGQLYLGLVPEEDSSGGVSTAGTHQQTGENAVAVSAGGGGASDGAQRPGVAKQIFPPCSAAEDEGSPRWRWPAGWRFVCTGCGARDGTTSSGKGSVRTPSPKLAHGGAVSGFGSLNTVWPDQGAAVVVFVSEDGSSAPASITGQIAPLILKEAEDSQAERALQQARQIFDGLLEGKINRDLLTPNADAHFTPQVLEDASASLKAMGPPESLSQTSVATRWHDVPSFHDQFQRQVLAPEHPHAA